MIKIWEWTHPIYTSFLAYYFYHIPFFFVKLWIIFGDIRSKSRLWLVLSLLVKSELYCLVENFSIFDLCQLFVRCTTSHKLMNKGQLKQIEVNLLIIWEGVIVIDRFRHFGGIKYPQDWRSQYRKTILKIKYFIFGTLFATCSILLLS